MKTKPYLVVYNINPDESFNCDNMDRFEVVLFENKICDSTFYNLLNTTLTEEIPVIVIKASVVLPPYWSERLLQGINNPVVDLCSALTCHINSLSPLAEKDEFSEGLVELDNLIYLLQTPQLIYTNNINTECFVVKNKRVLSELEKFGFRACNNLLVQSKTTNNIHLTDNLKLGNQNPLPAHALAELQWRLTLYVFKSKPINA
jgi:hypothetical protein